jgi:hypothetical protein
MDEPPAAPDPVTQAPIARPSGVGRRWFLAGGGAVVVGLGAGVATQFLTRDVHRPARPAPSGLVAAADAERRLIADLDATTGGSAAVREVIASARADHAAHLAAIEQLLRGYDTRTLTPVTGTARSTAELAAAERSAATSAATRAAGSTGSSAPLFASISASESVHAELLR